MSSQAELLYELFTPSSTHSSPVWNDLRRRLNVPTPPSDLTLTLSGGQSLELNRKVVVRFYKKQVRVYDWPKDKIWLSVAHWMYKSKLDLNKSLCDLELIG